MNNFVVKHIISEKIESGMMYGQFLIDSLLPGQGITIGNLLRRIMLGDLGGTSITGIRIPGIKDEFSVIPGVREDILELLLNIKGIVLKSNQKGVQFGSLKVSGPCIVTASSLQLPANLEVINPNHYIATVSNSNYIEIEFKIEYGTGYQLANKTSLKQSTDFLSVDAVFMPVHKVDFKIENIENEYEDKGSSTERLFFEVWTDGSIAPEDTFLLASEFIIDLFSNLFINKFSSNENVDEIITIEKAKELYGNIPIEELRLSVRPYNCLKRAEINTVSKLLDYSPDQLQELKSFGKKSGTEVYNVLKNKFGIIFE